MLPILMRCKTTSDLYQAFEELKFYGTSRSKANCQDSDQGSGYGQRLQMIDLAPEFRPREPPRLQSSHSSLSSLLFLLCADVHYYFSSRSRSLQSYLAYQLHSFSRCQSLPSILHQAFLCWLKPTSYSSEYPI